MNHQAVPARIGNGIPLTYPPGHAPIITWPKSNSNKEALIWIANSQNRKWAERTNGDFRMELHMRILTLERSLDRCKIDALIKITSAQVSKQFHTSQERLPFWAALVLFGGTMPRKKAHVYLIHFEHKYHHAGHYLGFTKHLWFRIITHRANMGARLLRAVNHAGINWVVVRTWTVKSQDLERKLKNLKNSPRLCPICNPDLEGQVQNEYARMKWELDQSVYNPNLPLPW